MKNHVYYNNSYVVVACVEMADATRPGEEMIDVRRAATLVGRHPETVRRWVWSGRLAAKRRGNHLLLARADVEAIATSGGGAITSLAKWADLTADARVGNAGSGRSAADLVTEDRTLRSEPPVARAGR